MAIVLIKSDSAGFFVQISSQNHGAAYFHQMGNGVRYLFKDMPSKQAVTCAQRAAECFF